MAVLLETSMGELVVDLHVERCPKTTRNFLKLCKTKYYNNCLFHNVQRNFMVQTGDPTGTGKGGESIYGQLYGEQARFFADEVHPALVHDRVGVVSMASAGPDLNASQFFILTSPNGAEYLDGKHTVFGQVSEGLDVLAKIDSAFCDEDGRPYQNIRIKHTHVLDDPFEDPKGLRVPERSPSPCRDEHDRERLPDDAKLHDEDADLPLEEARQKRQKQEAHSRAVVLEMIGDIPEADVKPPSNVLFVCKLNPVTKDEDLELIFSRFGTIKSCEVIRDWKTQDSLQYAFIEFETDEECEQAYLKMDNVLIDDRRIHVDFSQSVAKLWNSWRRGDKQLGQGGKSASGGRYALKNESHGLNSLAKTPRQMQREAQDDRKNNDKRGRRGRGK